MSDRAETQLFNLKVVVHETGLKPDTIRAWERRYGLPQPRRSSGGHRLYSRRDIEIIKWLMARQEEGLSISNAVDLWASLESEGQDPLHVADYAAPQMPITAADGTIADIREAWVAACNAFDERRAEQVLTQAFALYPPEIVCLNVLMAGLAQIGDGWYEGQVTVQQEHFASELAIRRLETLIAAAPAPTRRERILVAAPPEEAHDFILLVVTLLLRRGGWDVVYLGANVPLEQLGTVVAATKPRLVVSAVQQLVTAASLMEMAEHVHRMGIPLAFGGRIFNEIPALRARIRGYFLGVQLDTVSQVAEQVLASAYTAPVFEAPSENTQQALAHFREQQPIIETQLWQEMGGSFEREHMIAAISNMARDIKAALKLGDMDLLNHEISWIEGLLVNNDMPAAVLYKYLEAYYRAASTHLDARGAPVVIWLAQLSEQFETDPH